MNIIKCLPGGHMLQHCLSIIICEAPHLVVCPIVQELRRHMKKNATETPSRVMVISVLTCVSWFLYWLLSDVSDVGFHSKLCAGSERPRVTARFRETRKQFELSYKFSLFSFCLLEFNMNLLSDLQYYKQQLIINNNQ